MLAICLRYSNTQIDNAVVPRSQESTRCLETTDQFAELFYPSCQEPSALCEHYSQNVVQMQNGRMTTVLVIGCKDELAKTDVQSQFAFRQIVRLPTTYTEKFNLQLDRTTIILLISLK